MMLAQSKTPYTIRPEPNYDAPSNAHPDLPIHWSISGGKSFGADAHSWYRAGASDQCDLPGHFRSLGPVERLNARYSERHRRQIYRWPARLYRHVDRSERQ